LILADTFPSVLYRHNVEKVPHMIIDDKIHVEGVLDEGGILKHLAKAVARRAT
jgi:predicted DsbA family dithiol-disulfide isomerase